MLRVRLPVLCCACIIIRAHAAAYLTFHDVEANARDTFIIHEANFMIKTL